MSAEAYIWLCNEGHRSAHSDVAVRSLLVHPRCPRRVSGRGGGTCWALLWKRVDRLPAVTP